MGDTADIKLLQDQMRGKLLVCNQPAFTEARKIFNARIDNRPSLIAYCEGVSDVVACVKYAAQNGLRVGSRCGGHSPAGFSVPEAGLLIDVSRMKGVIVDTTNNTAIVQGGFTWFQLNNELTVFNLACPGGGCPSVGVSGFCLNGGYGHLSRQYGMGCDNILRLWMVNADGNEIIADKDQNTDLFWALRGAGAGNFGVVTAMQFQLHPVGTVYGGSLIWPFPQAASAMATYFSYFSAPSSSRKLSFYGTLATDPASGDKAFILAGCYFGPEAEALVVLQPFLKTGTPINAMAEMSYREFASGGLTGGEGGVYQIGQQAKWKTGYLRNPQDLGPSGVAEMINDILSNFSKAPSKYTMVNFDLSGGAIFDFPEDYNAFPHRSTLFSIDIIAVWDSDLETQANMQWASEFYKNSAVYRTGFVYENYTDVDLVNWQSAYFTSNHYSKLQGIKLARDPNCLFSSFPQAIELPTPKGHLHAPHTHPPRMSKFFMAYNGVKPF